MSGPLRRRIGVAAAANVVSAVATAATHVGLAATLGDSAYGGYAAGATLARLLSVPAGMALEQYGTQQTAAYRARGMDTRCHSFARWSGTSALRVSSALAAVAGFVILVAGDRLDPVLRRTFLLGLFAVPLASWTAARVGWLRGHGHLARARLPEGLVRPCLTYALVLAARSHDAAQLSEIAMGAHVLATWATAGLVAALSVLRADTPRPELDLSRTWSARAVPHAFIVTCRVALGSVDLLCVSMLLGTAVAGPYALASRLARAVGFGLVASNLAIAPLVAGGRTDHDAASKRHVVQRSTRIAVGMGLLIAAGLVALQPAVIRWTGLEGTGIPVLMAVFMAGQLISIATGPVGMLLNMTGHAAANARVMAVSATVALGIYPLAAVAGGAVAVAAATALAMAVQNLVTLRVVRRRVGIDPSLVGRC